ncbi:hypothetical protein TNIN_59121, partial [Trichonephila inaurata madagascariensis]
KKKNISPLNCLRRLESKSSIPPYLEEEARTVSQISRMTWQKDGSSSEHVMVPFDYPQPISRTNGHPSDKNATKCSHFHCDGQEGKQAFYPRKVCSKSLK